MLLKAHPIALRTEIFVTETLQRGEKGGDCKSLRLGKNKGPLLSSQGDVDVALPP